jgi:hypothetical protein
MKRVPKKCGKEWVFLNTERMRVTYECICQTTETILQGKGELPRFGECVYFGFFR